MVARPKNWQSPSEMFADVEDRQSKYDEFREKSNQSFKALYGILEELKHLEESKLIYDLKAELLFLSGEVEIKLRLPGLEDENA